jgi:hypothetical protein
MLLEQWSPVTSDFGLIQLPVDTVVREFVAWQASAGTDCSLRAVTSLAEALSTLPPLSTQKRRALLVPTQNGWTAYFQSGIDGSDPFPAMSYLARRLGVVAMRICSTLRNATWPATVWEVYAPEDQGGVPPLYYRRSICAMNDGGRWVFEQSGKPFVFEHLDYYDRPKKPERFTRELLAEYLTHFNLVPFDDEFFSPSRETPAILVDRHRASLPNCPEFTLEEVLAGTPWENRPA